MSSIWLRLNFGRWSPGVQPYTRQIILMTQQPASCLRDTASNGTTTQTYGLHAIFRIKWIYLSQATYCANKTILQQAALATVAVWCFGDRYLVRGLLSLTQLSTGYIPCCSRSLQTKVKKGGRLTNLTSNSFPRHDGCVHGMPLSIASKEIFHQAALQRKLGSFVDCKNV